jgi:DNA-binding transcriptional MerR regulator
MSMRFFLERNRFDWNSEVMTSAATLRAGDISDATGVPADTIRVWRHRGILPRKRGRGWTKYTMLDALRIAALAELVRRGMTSRAAARVVSRFQLEPETFTRPDVAIAVDLHSTWRTVRAALAKARR